MPRHLVRILALIALWAMPAFADGNARFHRDPTGTRSLSQKANRRLQRGDIRHATIRAPKGQIRLAKAQADRLIRPLLGRPGAPKSAALRAGVERYRAVRGRIDAAARAAPAKIVTRQIATSGGFAIDRVDLVADKPAAKRPRVLVVGGIHAGKERVGVEAALRFVEAATKDSTLRNSFDITVLPLLSPTALVRGTRRNHSDTDVNRSFADASSDEARVIRDMFDKENFDVVIDMHGAGTKVRNGFFMIRGTDDGGMSQRILSAMEGGALLNQHGAGTTYALDSMGAAISHNAGTLKGFAVSRGVRYAYTLEAPTRMQPERQVRGTIRFLKSTLYNIRAHGDLPK